jgi:hypothetical protein
LEDTPEEDPGAESTVDALTQALILSPGRTSELRLNGNGRVQSLTIHCAPPSGADDLGPVFQVRSSALGQDPRSPDRAGYFSWSGRLPTGVQTITVTGVSGSAQCRVTTGTASSAQACGRVVFRSPNANHSHFRVGTDASADWEPFPASGNHWGAWPAWNTVYPRPVLRGFLLHGLEHGGLVLSYKCRSATESAACTAAQNDLVALSRRLGLARVIVTPDPTQPALYGLRAWRWGYSSECLDAEGAAQFLRARYRRGREDIDADPPLPYDPSTTNVPCRNLMAAPDSC